MSIYKPEMQGDFTMDDLDDNSGYTNRKCPNCKKELYNCVNIDNPEHDFCEECGFERGDTN